MSVIGWFVLVAVAMALLSRWFTRRPESRRDRREADVASTLALDDLRWALRDVTDGVAVLDGSVVRLANDALVQLAGVTTSDLEGATLEELLIRLDPAATDAAREWAASVAAGREIVEPLVVHDVGDAGRSLELTVTVRAAPAPLGSDGARRAAPTGRAVVRVVDRTRRTRNDAALTAARRRFGQAFHSAPTGMALVRLDDGRVVDANQSLAEMLGVGVRDLIGQTLRERTHADDIGVTVPHQARLELGIVESYRVDQRYRRADGEYVWARTCVAAAEDDGVMLAITHIEDITEQRRTAEQLTHAASHDDLTGLPNRSHLLRVLTERLAEASPGTLGVLFVDLDHFKVVNDGLGHTVGDELLRALAQRLRQVVRGADVLARFGGDEFVVVLDGRGDRVDAREVAGRIRRAFVEPVVIGEDELFVTASIGYALNTDPDLTPHDLLRFADAAMYRAKARGRDAIEAFDVTDPQVSAVALRTSSELRRGLERGEVVPYFQPIVDLSTGTVVGHEVLARWLHPDRGLLAPAEFLGLAEETGQLIELGAVMLRDSLSQLARWRAVGNDAGRGTISVNVGTRQLVDPDFHAQVAEILAETGIEADSLWLEITETSLLSDVKAATTSLRRLRSLGLHLAVDDFGTGYSSLTYLRRFPVEAIKIDRAFVTGIGLEHHDTTIVDAVVQLGQALGLVVVAEGIETPLQLSTLRELGCDRGQGYLFGRPRPAAIIEVERASVGSS